MTIRTLRGWFFGALFHVAACGGGPKSAPSAPTTVVVPAATATPAATTEPAASPPAEAASSEEDAAVPISATDPIWGSRDASATIVFFGDFQSPYTQQAVSTIQTLEEKYGPGELRVVWKDLPGNFHPEARAAAEAAAAVYMLGRDEAFWRFHAKVFANQASLGQSAYEQWAAAAGVDVEAFRRLVADHAGAAKVDASVALSKRLSAKVTPFFFVNGVSVSGSQPIDKFVAIIEAEREKAKERVARGIAADRVYFTAALENYKPPLKEAADPKLDTTVYLVPLGTAPTRGPASARVKIVEFGDFQCPYTKRVEETLAKVLAKYGDQVQLVWRDEPLPFHPLALPAAEVAREARSEKGLPGFWAVHDALFALPKALEEADLMAVAKGAGLDPSLTKRALDKQTHKAGIGADQDLSDDLQASGTPHFFINGRRLVGAQPLEKFVAIIDEEIAHADRLISAGTTPARVYDVIMKDGKAPAPPEARYVAPGRRAPTRGGPGAKVIIEEFSDFECPFCKRAQDAVKEILQEYGSKGNGSKGAKASSRCTTSSSRRRGRAAAAASTAPRSAATPTTSASTSRRSTRRSTATATKASSSPTSRRPRTRSSTELRRSSSAATSSTVRSQWASSAASSSAFCTMGPRTRSPSRAPLPRWPAPREGQRRRRPAPFNRPTSS
jgi:protein-disulfide isomerase